MEKEHHFYDATHKYGKLSDKDLANAISKESEQFREYYIWLENHMPKPFFEEFEQMHLMTIVHNMLGLELQENFNITHFKGCSIVLCLDHPDADLMVLSNFKNYGIENLRTYTSDIPLPFSSSKLRITIVRFTDLDENDDRSNKEVFTPGEWDAIFEGMRKRDENLTREEFDALVRKFSPHFLRSIPSERLILALDMARLALTRDHIKYELRYNKDWDKDPEGKIPSLALVFAWRNVPKYTFIYRLAKLFSRHNLVMQRCNAAYLNPYKENSTLVMSVAVHGKDNLPAWEATNIKDFLQELSVLKFFDEQDAIDKTFVKTGLLTGNQASFVRSAIEFSHQLLLHDDPNLFSHEHVQEALCKHIDLTVQLARLFELKFHPSNHDINQYEKEKAHYIKEVDSIDTGRSSIDNRRRAVLQSALLFIEYTLKTNFYRLSKLGIGFRIDPNYLAHAPYDTSAKFPAIPYGIFFIRGKNFMCFHIRFKDLSRGGLRTICPRDKESSNYERANVFSECYNLAYTQQQKNKDIPEGGSKGVILTSSHEEIAHELTIFKKELRSAGFDQKTIERRLEDYATRQKNDQLYQTQRACIYTLLSLVNCHPDGSLKAKEIIDYYALPEYVYLGPDENMHDSMLDWIARFSEKVGYEPGAAFISSKPGIGINHKEFGITSFGVNVYMEEVLRYLGIDPKTDTFTVKITGGPDGDVAGNQMANLYKLYPNTAKLLAITDGSGTIHDPVGLDLETIHTLFQEGKAIAHYPPEKLNPGGFLLDLTRKKQVDTYSTQTTCWKMTKSGLKEELLNGNESAHLFRFNVHQCPADIFIPAGGRPRTLNADTVSSFLDANGHPTSKAIVEGANLYLTPEARQFLEDKHVLIIKDSSANKGGVICSSFEVLSGLTLTKEEFLKHKQEIVTDILAEIRKMALSEARLILETHAATGNSLIETAIAVSAKINTYMYQILDALETIDLSHDPETPLNQCLIAFCPKFIRTHHLQEILYKIPPIHKKAIISCFISAHLIYSEGLDWAPNITDVLPSVIDKLLPEQ